MIILIKFAINNKRNMRKSIIGGIFLTVVFLSFLAFINQAVAIEITNPLKHQTFEELIKAIIVFLRNLALAATALVIVLAGFYFVTAAGDPAKVTMAKQMILYALIGLAIVLAAEGIVALIGKVIKGK